MPPRSTVPLLFAGLALALVVRASGAEAADSTTAECLSANDTSIALKAEHRFRDARRQLLICAASSCPADVRTECSRRVAEINAAIPTIVFEAVDASGGDLIAVKITMDGQLLASRLEGVSIALDPGAHSFVFEVAGRTAVRKNIVVREGEKERRERVVFEEPTPVPSPTPTPTLPPPATPQAGENESRRATDWPRRTVGIVLGAGGLGGVGWAVYEQLTALSRQNDSRARAESGDPTAVQVHAQAVQAQTYAIVSGAVGAAAIVTGVVLVATSFGAVSPKRPSAWHIVPDLAARRGGLAIASSW